MIPSLAVPSNWRTAADGEGVPRPAIATWFFGTRNRMIAASTGYHRLIRAADAYLITSANEA